MIIKTYIESLNFFNNSNCLCFKLSCIQVTRSVLITTVKEVSWEIIYFVPPILPLLITLEIITRSIYSCRKKVIENFIRFVQK